MAEDSARLTIELLDRSGGNTATPAPGNSAAGPSIPGTDLAQQYQQQITSQGAGSKAGSGSVPAPTSTPSSIPSPTPSSTPTPVDIAQPLEANKSSIPDIELPFDLSKSGPIQSAPTSPQQPVLSSSEAQELLDKYGLTPSQVGGVVLPSTSPSSVPGPVELPKNEPVSTPTGTPQPTPTSNTQLPEGPLNYYFNTTSAQREVEQMFGDTDAARAREAQTAMREAAAIQRANAAKREEANVQAPITAELVPDIDPRAASLVKDATANLARDLGSMVSSYIGGPVGSLAGMGINRAAPFIGEAVASNASAVASLAPLAPYAGVAALAIGAPIAAAYAIDREAERAYQRIRDLSPEVAVSDAINELRQLQADLRTSVRLGDEIAERNRAQSIQATEWQGIKDKLGEPLIDEMNIAQKWFARDLQVANQILDRLERLGFEFAGILPPALRDRLNAWLDRRLGEDPNVMTPDWMDDQPFLPVPAPFNGMDVTGNLDRTTAEFGDIPGMRF